jgi:hypothetical protein
VNGISYEGLWLKTWKESPMRELSHTGGLPDVSTGTTIPSRVSCKLVLNGERRRTTIHAPRCVRQSSTPVLSVGQPLYQKHWSVPSCLTHG